MSISSLSVRQPWCWLLANGYKTIENRSFAIPDKYTGIWIALHAGRSLEDDSYTNGCLSDLQLTPQKTLIMTEMNKQKGNIIALIKFAGNISRELAVKTDPRFTDYPRKAEFHWLVLRVLPLQVNIPLTGNLGFSVKVSSSHITEVINNYTVNFFFLFIKTINIMPKKTKKDDVDYGEWSARYMCTKLTCNDNGKYTWSQLCKYRSTPYVTINCVEKPQYIKQEKKWKFDASRPYTVAKHNISEAVLREIKEKIGIPNWVKWRYVNTYIIKHVM